MMIQHRIIRSFESCLQERMDENPSPEGTLPGFRFHPTEEELVSFYLNRAAAGMKLPSEVIGFLNIYHHDPGELPGMAKINGEREWYFFVYRDRRKGHGGRPSRTTKNGFWKATGSDRKIRSLSEAKKVLGLKKTLVFYTGRAPRGSKTDWVMSEYRLPDNHSSQKEDVVLCKIYRKATSLKIIEQRAAVDDRVTKWVSPNLSSPRSQESPEENFGESLPQSESSMGLKLGCLNYCSLRGLDVPKFSMDPTNDPLWAHLRSPLLDYLSPGTLSSLLNY